MSDEAEITKLLQTFFDEMGEWEAWCAKRRRERKPEDKTTEGHERSKALSISALERIFAKYCTTWDEPQRAEGGTIHYSMIPVYGSDLEETQTISVAADTARVVTKQTTAAETTFVYYLKRTDSGWKIEDNRKFVTHDGDEIPYDL